MEVEPSESEMLLLSTEQVRNHKPMQETWKFLDQCMLPDVAGIPTYRDYLNLCCKFVDREAKQTAKYALMGRSSKAAPVNPKPKAHGTAPAPNRTSVAAGPAQWATVPSRQVNPQLAVKDQGVKRSDPDFKLCKEKSWRASVFKHGSL